MVYPDGNPSAEVDIGPYICLFRRERPSAASPLVAKVYMYDRVSGEAALSVPLPFSDIVTSASMLNPTTMLVVQGQRVLVVALDPALFQRFSDAD
ncbi:hypothetical protein KIPB_004636 [Kipferlia bialata]|uniref:Cleavage/polyadenylation specificity factor A subunit C-terminal domain-containing protein n=1 Tax=Kipferlia bialata TaxID=797122 RepID=A0A391NVT7_9EUKA|nr:hypothetical protein KIPB_004636 [Kipferlia bialata]|eukprot:g4636.t1